MQKKRGFTLIELLVVIAIIGLLATIITASLGSARQKGRDAQRIANIRVIQTSLELYYNDNLRYPTNIYAGSGSLSPNYISVVPVDPGGSMTPSGCSASPGSAGCYVYSASAFSNSSVCNASNPAVKYHLGVALEQSNNSVLSSDVDAAVQNFATTGYTVCTGGAGDFSGLSAPVSPAACTSVAGSAQPGGTETCYDATN